MDMESTDNGADNDASAPDATEIVDNGANSEIVHSQGHPTTIFLKDLFGGRFEI